MIGQYELKRALIDRQTLPQFMIISGPAGSGKSLLINNLCKVKLNCDPIEISTIDDVRDICLNAVSLQKPQAYVLNTFDTVNFRTKESILKLCEEPPKHVYIFIETRNLARIKQTLTSRATVFDMLHYSKDELRQYCLTLDNMTDSECESIINICNTPGRVRQIHEYSGGKPFIAFCNTVVSNISKVPFSNALKISNKLKLKADAKEGYDIDIFFETVSTLALQNVETIGIDIAYNIISSCSKALQSYYQTPSLNKQMLFDTWVMNIRGIV